MENTELHKLLEQIHHELQKVRSVDEKDEQILRDLSDDIQGLLGQPLHEPVQAADSTLERIEQVINQAEVEHPVLTSTLSQLLEVLSNAGI